VARPPSRVYEFRKAVQRHKVGFAASAAVFIALVFGLSLAIWAFVRERAAYRVAESARASEVRLREKLESRVKIVEARKLFAKGNALEAEKMLNDIRPELIDPPSEQLEVRRMLAWEFAKQSLWSHALSNFSLVLQINRPGTGTADAASDDYYYTTALVVANDLQGYDKFRREILAQGHYRRYGDFLFRLTLLTPANDDLMRILSPYDEVAEKRVEYGGSRPNDERAWNRFARALYAFRSGDMSSAILFADECLAIRVMDPTVEPCVRALKAWIFCELGQVDDAKRSLESGRKVVDPVFEVRVSSVTSNQGRWFEWYLAKFFLDEAAKMIDRHSPQSR